VFAGARHCHVERRGLPGVSDDQIGRRGLVQRLLDGTGDAQDGHDVLQGRR
jgi:hypothetical protein